MLQARKISISDKDYPARLKNIYSPPVDLYIKGEFLPEDEIAVALVGSRKASQYGLELSEKLA